MNAPTPTLTVVLKPISASLLLARVKTQLRIKHMADELRRIATIDTLPGGTTRRRFDESRRWAGRAPPPGLSPPRIAINDCRRRCSEGESPAHRC